MRIHRENSSLNLSLNLVEARFLRHVLSEVIRNYRLRPEELAPKAAHAWYSTRGCSTAKMSAEETREWLKNLHSFKEANLARLEDWARQLGEGHTAHYHLQIKLDDAPHLMTALNDHRLLAAAQHDIGRDEMDANSLSAFAKLRADQRSVLYEIHLLAHVIEEILRALPDSPSNWER